MRLIIVFLAALLIGCINNEKNISQDKTGPYNPIWESISQWQCPEWYKDSKLGIFIHWGVYAVPAYESEWYPRFMYVKSDDPDDPYNYHRRTWGDQKKFGYKDFVPLFTAEKWDPEEWIDLFVKAGASYVIPVAEHHDAFAMYNSSHTRWNSVNMGPKRDILGELFTVGRKRGLKMGASSHLLFNWYYFTHDDDFDTMDPQNWDLYGKPHAPGAPMSKAFLNHMWNRTTEIVDKYQPDIMWFDFVTTYPYLEETNKKFAAYYYNKAVQWGKEVAINVKGESYPREAAVHDIERGKFAKMSKDYWQTDNSISNRSWGYIENDNFKPTNTLVDDLVDIVSKNGCILWNIGPRADGTIPDEVKQRLLEVGNWMDINKEAINGSRPWIIYGEGPTDVKEGFHLETSNEAFTSRDIRFTIKDGNIYLIALDWPQDVLEISSFGKEKLPYLKIRAISMLGSEEAVTWERDNEKLLIQPPARKANKFAFTFKLEVDGFAVGDILAEVLDNNTVRIETEIINFTNDFMKDEISLVLNDHSLIEIQLNIASQGRSVITREIQIGDEGLNTIDLQLNGQLLKRKQLYYPFIALKGIWKMKTGDESEWLQMTFDDSDWKEIQLPAYSRKDKQISPREQLIYYRKKIFIPKEYRDFDIKLPFGEIWEVDEIYFNGRHIGGQGEFPPTHEGPNYESFWCYDRYYDVPKEVINYGADNLIALRVYSKFKDNGPVDEKLGYIQMN